MGSLISSIPQLRVRTEFTFRAAFGPINDVAARLAELGAPAAGIVDPETWGHVRWAKALQKVGVAPMFGAELPLPQPGGRAPRSWLLCRSTAEFYSFLSHLPDEPGPADLDRAGAGALRFVGGALETLLVAPDVFDYVDLSPASPLAARHAYGHARRLGKKIVVTSDNAYPAPGDRPIYQALTGSGKVTPQHLLSDAELRASFSWLDDDQWREAVANTHEVAERLKDVRLARAPMIHFDGDLGAEVERGRQYRLAAGHIREWTDAYATRLDRELKMIAEKKYESYFLVVGDLVRWAKTQMLVGPARGSSAGSLVCYLLRITEVDPLPHDLLFERFIDINRNDLPDIDIDFSDQHRDKVFDYLRERYGADNVARLGNISTLKPRSVLAEAGKRLGIPAYETFSVRNVLIEYSSGDSRYGAALQDTLRITAPGRAFMEKYPEAAVMARMENHAWHTSVHAAGVVVCNEPVTNFCVVRDGVAHLDKPDSEHLNLLKIDALGLRTLGVIEDAKCVTAEQLYSLTTDDPAVFKVFNDRKYAGVFQFEGAAQRRVTVQVPITNFQRIDHVTALARPGPLGGGATNAYIRRIQGVEPVEYRHPSMAAYLGDTMGVVLYQEQVMRISREIGQLPWEVVSEIRKSMSGRKGKEYFDRRGAEFKDGAIRLGLTENEAQTIWDEICSFGAWGMNKSHTVSYSIIAYWCAWMKAYHPLEYAAALLRNAKDDLQVMEALRELVKEGVRFVPFDRDLSEVDWSVKEGVLYGGLVNIVGVGAVKARGIVARRAAGTLTSKDEAVLAAPKLKFSDLREAHTMWGPLYDEPRLARPEWGLPNGCAQPIREIADLEDRERACVIVKVLRRERRDENETIRKAKRGREYEGQPLFLDLFVVDDSITKPVMMRIKTYDWFAYGEKLADGLRDDQDWLLVYGKWIDGFSMMAIERVKCLTQPDLV